MRAMLFVLPLALCAAPATAAPKSVPGLPEQLTDPAMADKLGRMAGALTRALMKMPVGEIEAAAQGREPTATERGRTVGDALGDPDAPRKVEEQAARSGRIMQAGAQAMARSLPALMAALDEIEASVDRAVSNLPDPTYPRR